jgi:hypothetical protein
MLMILLTRISINSSYAQQQSCRSTGFESIGLGKRARGECKLIKNKKYQYIEKMKKMARTSAGKTCAGQKQSVDKPSLRKIQMA